MDTIKSDKKMLKDGIIHFFSRKKEYTSLSNFWEGKIRIVDGEQIREYESGEHCIYGEQYIRIGNLCSDENKKRLLIEYGNTFIEPSIYKTAIEVKKVNGKKNEKVNIKKGIFLNDIELNIWQKLRLDVQKGICRWKFDNDEQVRQDIIKSGNKILIHPAMRYSEEKVIKQVWSGKGVIRNGSIIVLGENRIGNLWMELRNEMNKS